jgi:SAM-dependent methyltransferase
MTHSGHAGESAKSKERRIKEKFFENYCNGKGIDIGCGDNPLTDEIEKWDKQDGDACYMRGVENESFDFVYSSHCLEHLDFPHLALQNWFRILKTGGFLIVCVPHRDLYEKKRMLPSLWNEEHKSFWLPDKDDPPNTFSLKAFIEKWLTGFEIIEMKVCSDGATKIAVNQHSTGEYQIECIIKKL